MASLPPVNTPKTKTLVIKAGETGIIPSTAKIISVGISGNADAESDCPAVDDAIANAESYQCYEFVWEGDYNSPASSWQLDGVWLEAIELDKTVYEIEMGLNELNSTSPGVVGKIKTTVPSSVMKMADNVSGGAWIEILDNGRVAQAICFQTLPSIAALLRFKFRNDLIQPEGGEAPVYYIYPRLKSREDAVILGIHTWCNCPEAVVTT